MVRWALIFLATFAHAGSPSAFDPAAPDFWTKTYSFPSLAALCRPLVSLSVASVPATAKEIARKFGEDSHFFGDSAMFYLPVERSRLAETKKFLLSQGQLLQYNESCPAEDGPVYPELDYKKKSLTDESARYALVLSSLTAIPGLLREELGTLDHLIAMRDQGSQPVIQIRLSPAGTDGGSAGNFKIARKIAHKIPRFPVPACADEACRHDWRRYSPPICTVAPVSVLGLNVTPSRYENWRKLALKSGRPYEPDGCDLRRGPVTALDAIWIDAPALRRLRERADKEGLLSRWESDDPPLSPPPALSDADKLERLQSELAASENKLAGAVDLLNLVRAEISRLNHPAANARRARGRKLLYLLIVPEN